eukprot:TRINITY_DN2927_c0_g2_i1.p1 TRINITY_DN2927_c0_g2~~TRINITY_DN2927_c0_g2_i1.p1  ORF type:complete len:739 (-),score=159.51 TRINITY_DN2927_c0_g2_i1:178-2367(-)
MDDPQMKLLQEYMAKSEAQLAWEQYYLHLLQLQTSLPWPVLPDGSWVPAGDAWGAALDVGAFGFQELGAGGQHWQRHRGAAQHSQSQVMTAEECQVLLDELELGQGAQKKRVLHQLCGKVWSLAQDSQGCRLVQAALEQAKTEETIALAHELGGHVPEAATHRHANFVLQKIITQLLPVECEFVLRELVEAGPRVARNRCGCRIPIRLIERAAAQKCEVSLRPLVEKLLQETASLVEHKFGHHVVEAILKNGEIQYKERIAEALLSDLVKYARDRTASYVVEIALANCGPQERLAMLAKLSDTEVFLSLASHEFGSFVASAVLLHSELDATAKEQLLAALTEENKQQLLQTKHGERLLANIAAASSAGDETAGAGAEAEAEAAAGCSGEAWTWSAPVQETMKNGRTFVEAIVFHLALDKKEVRTKSTASGEHRGSFSIAYSSINNLISDKVTTQTGKEMTLEKYTQVIEETRKVGLNPPPAGSPISREDLTGKLKIQSRDGQMQELSFEEATLLCSKLRMQDGEIMSFIDFLALPLEKVKACFPIQVQVPKCKKQELKTSLMIRNLPNCFRRDDVAKLLNEKGFRCKYDFVYVPQDYKRSTGADYAIVNMGNSQPVTPGTKANMVHHTWGAEVWEVLEGYNDWKESNGGKSSKECEVTWSSSEHQGKEDYIARYRKSPVMREGTECQYKPAVFDDQGNMVAFPAPVDSKVGGSIKSTKEFSRQEDELPE